MCGHPLIPSPPLNCLYFINFIFYSVLFISNPNSLASDSIEFISSKIIYFSAEAGFKTISPASPTEEDEDLCVDDDDEEMYGKPQYPLNLFIFRSHAPPPDPLNC